MKLHNRIKKNKKNAKALKKVEEFEKLLSDYLVFNEVIQTVDILLVDIDEDFIHVNFEAWNTFKYSLRIKDNRWFREGTDLNGEGVLFSYLLDIILENVKAWDAHIKLYESLDPKTQFVLDSKIITHDGNKGHGVYRVHFNGAANIVAGKIGQQYSDVIEWTPERAARYIYQYERSDKYPVKVEYLGTEEDYEKIPKDKSIENRHGLFG